MIRLGSHFTMGELHVAMLKSGLRILTPVTPRGRILGACALGDGNCGYLIGNRVLEAGSALNWLRHAQMPDVEAAL